MARRIDETTAIARLLASGAEPRAPFVNTQVPWPAKCLTCNRHIAPTLNNLRSGRLACGYCLGTAVDTALATATMLLRGFQPQCAYPGSGVPWPCTCVHCGHTVRPTYGNVKKHGTGCKYCSRQAVDPVTAAAIMRAAGVEPFGDFPGATAPWPAECQTCLRMVSPRYTDVNTTGSGCAYCSGVRVDPGDAYDVMRRAGVTPLMEFPGSDKPWLCVCDECKEIVTPRYGYVRQGNGGCAFCSRRAQSLAHRTPQDEAFRVARKAGFEPAEPYTHGHHPWPMVCVKCGDFSLTRTLNNLRAGSRCRKCVGTGRYGQETVLYLVSHAVFDCIKVGVGVTRAQRPEKFRARGWDVIATWVYADGGDAHRVETETKYRWRTELGLPYGCTKEQIGKLGGYTETAPLSRVDVDAEVERLNKAWAETQQMDWAV